MSSRNKIVYFPFSPGIPWEISRTGYILPKISQHIWDNVVKPKDFVLVCDGGLIEAHSSLFFLEAMNISDPKKKIYWTGNENYSNIYDLNGLSTESEIKIKSDFAKRYPVPIFLDKHNVAYFNILNNYVHARPFTQKSGRINGKPVFKQVFENSLMNNWDIKYLPKIRKPIVSKELERWKGYSKFYEKKPFILLFPEETGFSIHKEICLNWSPTDVKAFSSICSQAGFTVVVCANNQQKYMNSNCLFIKPDLDFILFLMKKTYCIMSREIDFLLLGLLYSNAKIFHKKVRKKCFDPDANGLFIGSSNKIMEIDDLTPFSVFGSMVKL